MGRPLPWRLTDDAYRIWISEIMLQQTTVAAVIPYFERFVAAFPDVQSLAAASEPEVLKLWEGLGYYSRARNLRKAAGVIVAEHGSRFPSDVTKLQSLPGIGRYTAGAIASFAFDKPAPIVEANTERLYARLIAYDATLQNAAGKRALWQVAGELVPKSRPGRFNQAVMELGSQVCRIVDPLCHECPIATCCRAFAEGRVDEIPLAKTRAKITELTEAAIVVRRDDRYLLRQRMAAERWAGLWDFPRVELVDAAWLPSINGDRQPVLPGMFGPIEAAASESLGVAITVQQWITEFTHGVTRYRIRLLCLEATTDGEPQSDGTLQWATAAKMTSLPLAKPARRVADLLAGNA